VNLPTDGTHTVHHVARGLCPHSLVLQEAVSSIIQFQQTITLS